MATLINRKTALGNTIAISLNANGENFDVIINGETTYRDYYLLPAECIGLTDGPKYVISDRRTYRFDLLDGEYEILAAVRDAARKAKAEIQKRTARIHLSTRGWGDYSSCEWVGDITRPDAEILAECREALETGHDVDRRDQTDVAILEAIHKARAAWQAAQAPKPQQPRAEHGPGYCYHCESYCCGDCGHYTPTETVGTIKRDVDFTAREQGYGIDD